MIVGSVPQPILHTRRLTLVPLADEHLDREIELDSDPDVLRYLYARPRTRQEVVESHTRRLAAATEEGLGYWAAFLAGDVSRALSGGFVGLMMLPEGELGYRLMRLHWGQGLATEASRALLAHAFDTAGLPRVHARTMAVNLASRGVMRALGMRYVRTLHPGFDDPLPGTEQGEVEYEMTRAMWEARS